MKISHTKKFIFIHIPKTAGTTVSEVLQPYSENPKTTPVRTISHALNIRTAPEKSWFEQHDTALRMINRWGRPTFDEYFSFTFVRNPFQHAVSHYLFTQDATFGRPRRQTVTGMSFAEYLHWRLDGRHHAKMERRTRFVRMPDQSYYCLDATGDVAIKEVYQLENLSHALSELSAKFDLALPQQIPHRRNQKTAGPNTHLTSETIPLIQSLYDRDFSNFGYARTP